MKTAVYEILAIAPPDHRISRFIQQGTILLVCLNTIALLLSFVDVFRMYQIYFFWLVEALSSAFFTVEYVLRMWSAAESKRFRGRLRFGLRLLLLIDLAAILPFVIALLTPSRDITLRLLRLGWALRHLKLIRYMRPRLVIKASCDSLLYPIEGRLGHIRQQVAQGRERDLARVQQCLDATSRQCYAVSIRQHDFPPPASHPLALPVQPGDEDLSPLLSLLDQLAADLTDAPSIEEMARLISMAHQQSARIFDQFPETATVEVEPKMDELVGKKPVPLRRIGRKHFASMASRHTESFATRHPMYVADVLRELSDVRTAIISALDQSDSQEEEARLYQAFSALRDVDTPVRLAWDNLLWRLEEEHQRRLQLVRADIERYGSPWFYLGGLRRWLVSCLSGTQHVPELAARLWATAQRLRRELFASLYHVLRPVLQSLGLITISTSELLRALDAARLDSVLERGLPSAYLEHFAFSALTDEALCLEFDKETANINAAIGRWKEKLESSFILYGHRGVGKSTLLNVVRQRLFDGHAVTHEIIPGKITTTDALVEYLVEILALPAVDSFETLAQTLLVEPPRAVLLEDCHHLFLRNVGYLEAIRSLCWLIARTNHHILWGISLEQCGYDFLSQLLPLKELFHAQVGIQQRSGEDLRRLIMMRHNRSRIGLHYIHNDRHEKALRRQMRTLREQNRSGRANPQEALERIFFDQLAQTAAGNITVALFYWLRSLRAKDADLYEVQPFEELNLSLIGHFSEDQAFLLVAMLQHGQLTAMELATILDSEEIETRLELEILAHHNVLQFDLKTETFEVNPVVVKTVCAMLRSRNLLV